MFFFWQKGCIDGLTLLIDCMNQSIATLLECWIFIVFFISNLKVAIYQIKAIYWQITLCYLYFRVCFWFLLNFCVELCRVTSSRIFNSVQIIIVDCWFYIYTPTFICGWIICRTCYIPGHGYKIFITTYI